MNTLTELRPFTLPAPWQQLTLDERAEAVKHASHILTLDYLDDVEAIAADLVDHWRQNDYDGCDGWQQWLDETIDGHQRVIYTWQARCGLLVSDNADAQENENGEEGVGPEVKMYYALRADVLAYVRDRLDIDLDTPEDEDETEPAE